jgi:hypothetical protein
LLAEKSAAQKQRLQELLKKRDEDGIALSSSEETDLEAIAFVEEDIILMTPGAEETYDADKLRADRMRNISAAASSMDVTAAANRTKRISLASVTTITLRYIAAQHQINKENVQDVNMPEITLPFSATWPEVCDTLRKRFNRIAHFRYLNDKNVWLEVRSETAFAAFRNQMCEEAIEKGINHVVAHVQLLVFGSGAPPIVEIFRDGFFLSSNFKVPFLNKQRTKRMATQVFCVQVSLSISNMPLCPFLTCLSVGGHSRCTRRERR